MCVEYFGGINNFEKQVKRDDIKRKFCSDNNINLIEIKYNDNIKSKLNFIYEKEKV